MNLFNEMGSTLKKQMGIVSEKAKEVGGYAKIQTTIKGEELKMQEQYYKLGKKYYALYQEAPDLDLVEYVTKINQSKRKIEQLREEMKDKQEGVIEL